MKFAFVNDLQAHLAATFGTPVQEIPIGLCPPEFTGDLTLNGFVLARQLRRNPAQIAQAIGDFLAGHADVLSAQVVKAFVNVTLKPAALMRDTVSQTARVLDAVLLPESQRRRIVIEFSAPNTNKPQHLGHVRNNSLGMATAGLLRRVGHAVTRVNLINDRGIHICKSMLAYQRQGPRLGLASKETTSLVTTVAFDSEFRRQMAEACQTRPELTGRSADELFLETEIGSSAQNMLVAWERGDAEVRALWATMNGWVLDGFAETYRRMGVEFEHTYLESQTYTLGRDIIHEGLAKGVFRRRDDGAMVIDFADKSLGSKVVLRSDGTSVYVTQDIGTTLLKQHDFNPDQQIWVVGDEQIHHFRILFAILRALGYPWADRLVHMAYGMVNLPTGRMKSREGTVVDADDLFDEMESLARAATLERAGADVPENLDERARVIGMAAIKFMLLKVSPRTTIMFDPQASITFEGDTGPYVLYAYARISSMLRKAGALASDRVDWGVLGATEERSLALRCALYPETDAEGGGRAGSTSSSGLLPA